MALHDEPHTALTMVARYEALIRVSEALRAYHGRETLFRSLAHELHSVVHFSFLGLALYDERTQIVVPYVLQSTGEPGPLPELTSEDQLTYWVLRHQTPLIVDSIADETRFVQEIPPLPPSPYNPQQSMALARLGVLVAGETKTGVPEPRGQHPRQRRPQDRVFFTENCLPWMRS